MHKVKDGVYVINLDDKQSKRTHWISLFINWNTAAHFDSFGIEHNTAQEILHKNKIKEKSTIHNIFRLQSADSAMCTFYCIAFIETMLAEKFSLKKRLYQFILSQLL